MLSTIRNLSKNYNQKIKRINSGCPVIYQMGRVGSTSLEKAIPNSVHLHHLYTPSLVIAENKPAIPVFKSISSRFARLVLRCLIRRRRNKIICPVRHPSDRSVSMFFQMLPAHMLAYFGSKGRGQIREDNETALEAAFWHSKQLEFPEHWFKNELGRYLDEEHEEVAKLDHNGFKIIDGKHNSVFIYQIEKFQDVKSEIEKFLGQEVIPSLENRSSKKWYFPLYKMLKENQQFQLELQNESKKIKFIKTLGY